MNKKGLLHFIFYITLSLFIIILFRYNDWPGKLAFPVFLPLAFAIYHFVKSIVIIKEFGLGSSLKSLLISILFCFITAKVSYFYYNIFFQTIFCILCVIISSKSELKNYTSTVIFGLTLINIALIAIPNSWLGKYAFNTSIPYQYLSWDNFKGLPDSNSSFSAITSTGLSYKVNRVYSYPSGTVLATMDPNKSWVKKDKLSKFSYYYLLEHEQLHFDISKLYEIKANDSISQHFIISQEETESIIKHFQNEMEELNKTFDQQTNHGLDTTSQRKWQLDIHNQIK